MATTISSEKATEIANILFGISSEAIKLPGDVDHNFKIENEEGESFILKISQPSQASDFLNFQNEILKYLQTKSLSLDLPKVVPNLEGNTISTIEINGSHHLVRLLIWVGGRLWARANPKSRTLRHSLGLKSGELTKALIGFEHTAANRTFDWNLANATWTYDHIDRFKGAEKEIVSFYQNEFRRIQELYNTLPKSIIHNDVNDYNILVSTNLKDPIVSGIIDFGDAVHSQTVNDLAIVLAYAIMDVPNPLHAAINVIEGYNKAYPLSEEEIECLYTLVAMRFVTTVTKSSLRKAEDLTNEYHVISEKPAWEALKKWFKITPNFALYSFRAACDYEPLPSATDFKNWASHNKVSLKTVFPGLPIQGISNIDMSVGSVILGGPSEYSDIDISDFKIRQFQKTNPKHILCNGYLETRPFYTTNAFKSEGNSGPEYRTVHLGTDFWIPPQTAIHSPYDGKVFIVHHNDYDKDYGPMLIIEHEFEQQKFYTLYGHLTLSSLKLLKVGQIVKHGELIAYVGDPYENGNWVPHLHFQIILDLLNNDSNFPGVAFPSEERIWQSICPNPAFIFSEEIDDSEEKLSEEKLISFRKKHFGRGLSLSYSSPLHIVRGEGVFLFDTDGKKYLDTANNVNHVGHQHPRVVKAGKDQMAVLNTNTRYLHKNIVEYSEALLKKLPKELSVLHFVNSGSEANELAIRMAKTITKQEDMLAIEVGYHGNTNAVMDVSSYKFDGKGGSGKPETTHILPLPDPYRGRHTGENCGSEYARYAKKHIEHQKVLGEGIAGFIGESMISCGGQIVPPTNYFKEVYQYVRDAGGICIADEVQTGFGRMGKTFWAFELYDVVPDIVTMGKPAGNGHPLAVVACTQEVADAFSTGMEYFNTFGGNPVSCAIGKAVLDIIEEEQLQKNAFDVGGFLKSELINLQKDFPIIGDVRGEGLFLGFELNNSSKMPLAAHASYLADRMKDLGILMSTDGPDYNVLKIKPPMVFSIENAKELIFRLRTVFSEDFMSHY